MLRGYIEYVSKEEVHGWIHAEGVSLRGRTILAFAGDQCIGSGSVGKFRQDLFDAGLGDGYLGFGLAIAGQRVSDLGSIVVRLDGSDACLIQAKVSIHSGAQTAPKMSAEQFDVESAHHDWMLRRGWIDHSEHEFLMAMTTNGVYPLGLPKAMRAPEQVHDAADAQIQRMFALVCQRDVTFPRLDLTRPDEFKANLAPLVAATVPSLVALSGGQFALKIAEGSHLASAVEPEHALVVQEFRPWQILFLDTRCLVSDFSPVDGVPVRFASVAFSS
jgi:hypothetical protein